MPTSDLVGTNSFRGTMNSTASRMSLYMKNDGNVARDNTRTALRVESAISGTLLVTPLAQNKPTVRDPISGTPLRQDGTLAHVTTPVTKNHFAFSKVFYLERDVDVTIQTLRSTTKVNKYTNEKVGTAGTPTGLDNTLSAFKKARGTMSH